jgi:GTP cyclohydrolase II
MSFPTRYNAISGFDLEIVEYVMADGTIRSAEEGVMDAAAQGEKA